MRGALEARSARAQELEAELSAVRAELVERRDEADAEDELNAARRAFRDSVDRIDGLERQLRAARSNLSESRLAEAALTWKLDTVEQSLELRLEAAEEVEEEIEASLGARIWEQVGPLLVAVLIALGIRAMVIESYYVPSESMLPTLLIGDHVFVNKFVWGARVPFTEPTVERAHHDTKFGCYRHNTA